MIKNLCRTVCSASRQHVNLNTSPWQLLLGRRLSDGVKDTEAGGLYREWERRGEMVSTRNERAKIFMENLDDRMKQQKELVEIEIEMLRATSVQVCSVRN